MNGPATTAVIFRDPVVAAPIGLRNLATSHEAAQALDEAVRLIETLKLGNALRADCSMVTYQSLAAAARAGGMVVTDPMTMMMATGSSMNWYQGLPINLDLIAQATVAGASINMIHMGGGGVRTCNWQSGVAESLSSPAAAPTVDGPSTTYADLFAAIAHLERLDQEDSRYIDTDAARAARAFVSLLSLYSVPAPQLFSHSSDTIVFKWTQPDCATYVTLVDGTASLRGYVSGQPIGPAKSFQISVESELVTLMLGLGGKRWRAVNAV